MIIIKIIIRIRRIETTMTTTLILKILKMTL